MKRLTLVRHAKSDWKNSALKDFDRPLSRRGLREAPGMAELLARQKVHADLMITSPAVRALETARVFAGALDYPLRRLKTADRLYLARPADILEVVRGVGARVQHLMIFGHNPGLSEFAQELTGDAQLGELPTCAVYTMEFAIGNWTDARYGEALKPVLSQPRNFLDLLS
ncbi:MAG TPA: histidine phosphatase family protein [Steroidobacteraceae bacterium]|jgi:phosphohistidine phosphatase|nr:histidine phosphatase family protein [Steroidobacteraceae bacterium]